VSRLPRFATKRLFDIVASCVIMTALLPVFLMVAAIVYLSLGPPIFFRQPRIGWKGCIFRLYKFRTMTEARDAEGRLLPDAERLTRVGRFLRETTLDEIPELINVVSGDMSLVGPRPLLVEYKALYSLEQWRRHDMPPGMAGPVLAGGRNALSWDEKFALDVWYVDNWSLWLDFKILIRTAWKVLRREGVSAEGHVTAPRFTGSRDATGEAGEP
jgi:sugar transferase EpsL